MNSRLDSVTTSHDRLLAKTPYLQTSEEEGRRPWDPDLQAAFADRRLVVHEVRLLDDVLG